MMWPICPVRPRAALGHGGPASEASADRFWDRRRVWGDARPWACLGALPCAGTGSLGGPGRAGQPSACGVGRDSAPILLRPKHL